MKDLGIVQSTERPSDVDIRETKVFVASDVKEVHEKKTDEQPGFDGYSYNLKEYDKDEYIKSIQAKNAELLFRQRMQSWKMKPHRFRWRLQKFMK